MHESPQKQRCVFVCMELSSKLELVYILYNWICCLIFTLIYKGGTVDYSLGRIYSTKLGLTIFSTNEYHISLGCITQITK